MSCLIESPCRTVCMNCLAWFRLNSSREALASPIWRMPRFLFQSVLDRVRCGIATAMSLPLNAEVATLSARLTTFASVDLSRSRIRLLTRSAAAVSVFFFAMILSQILELLGKRARKPPFTIVPGPPDFLEQVGQTFEHDLLRHFPHPLFVSVQAAVVGNIGDRHAGDGLAHAARGNSAARSWPTRDRQKSRLHFACRSDGAPAPNRISATSSQGRVENNAMPISGPALIPRTGRGPPTCPSFLPFSACR